MRTFLELYQDHQITFKDLETANAAKSALQPVKVNGRTIGPSGVHAQSQAVIRRPDLTAEDWRAILVKAGMKLQYLPIGKYLVYSVKYQQAIVVHKSNKISQVITIFPKGDHYARADTQQIMIEGFGELRVAIID